MRLLYCYLTILEYIKRIKIQINWLNLHYACNPNQLYTVLYKIDGETDFYILLLTETIYIQIR